MLPRLLTLLNLSEKQDADSLSSVRFNYLDESNINQTSIVAQSHDGV
jgi:hypothetical protein